MLGWVVTAVAAFALLFTWQWMIFDDGIAWKLVLGIFPVVVLAIVVLFFGLTALIGTLISSVFIAVTVLGVAGTILALPIELLARGLDRPRLNTWIKAITVLVILVGFHFDLLAS